MGIDDSGFSDGIDGAEKKASSFGDKFGAVASGIAKAAATITAVATGIATAMAGIATSSAAAGDRIDKMSQKLGISREAFQEWDYILSQNGSSVDSLGVTMKTLQNAMSGVTDSGKSTAAVFGEIGLSFEEVSALSPEDAFAATVAALQDMEEGADKTAAAVALFGKNGMDLLPLLNQTADGTEELRQKAHDLGLVLSDEAVDAGVEFTDALDTAQRAISAMSASLGAELLPSLTAGIEAFIAFFSGAEGAEDQLQLAFDGIIEAITGRMPEFIEKGGQIILSMISGLAGALPNLVSGVMEIIPTISTTILEMLPDIIEAGFEVLLAVIAGISDALPELIPAAVQAVITIAESLVNNIDRLIEAAGKLIVGIVGGLINAIPILVASIPTIIASMVQAFLSFDWLGLGKELISGIIGGIKGMATKAVDAVKDVGGKVLGGIKSFFGIASPSKVFAEIGGFLMEGLSDGMEDNSDNVLDTANDITGDLKGELTDVSPKENNLNEWIGDLETVASVGIPKLIDGIAKMFEELPMKMDEAIAPAKAVIENLFNGITDVSINKLGDMNKVILNLASQLPGLLNTAITPSKKIVTEWGNALIEIAQNRMITFVDTVINIVSGVPLKFYEAILPTIQRIEEWGARLIDTGRKIAEEFVAIVSNIAGTLPSKMYDIGINLVESMWYGVQSRQNWFYNKIYNFFSSIVRQAESALGIASPSKEMIRIGKYTAEGFVVGMEQMASEVEKTVNDLFDVNELSRMSGNMMVTTNAANATGTSLGSQINVNQTINASKMTPYEAELAAVAQFKQALWGVMP